MSEDLETIYTAMDEIQAEVIKAVLEGAGIESFLENENQALLAGCIPVRVQVRTSDVEEAKNFIAEHENSAGSEEKS
jgi:putative signal transducing protein